jgi:hypothetical protein
MIPGRTPMKPSICSSLRRRSFVRSAAVRSGLDRISIICADDSGGEACSASVACMPSRRTVLVTIATKTSFVRFSLVYPPSFASANHTRRIVNWRFHALAGSAMRQTQPRLSRKCEREEIITTVLAAAQLLRKPSSSDWANSTASSIDLPCCVRWSRAPSPRPSLSRRDGSFESGSLQQTVRLSRKVARRGREPRIFAPVCTRWRWRGRQRQG